MLSEEEKNASGCLVIVGLVLVSFAVGMATAPWAGFALCGVALVAIAVIGIYAGKRRATSDGVGLHRCHRCDPAPHSRVHRRLEAVK